MKKYLIVTLFALMLCLGFSPAQAAINFYGAIAFTGGATGALDKIPGTNLATGDVAYVVTDEVFCVLVVDALSGAAEASPDIIKPDTDAGDKRWILVFYGDSKTGDIARLVPTDSYFIVGDGATWVRETGATVLTSLGLTIGIADDNVVAVDSPGVGAPATGEYAKWTANGLESKSIAEAIVDFAHKDYHDPQDGGDKLDTAVGAEVSVVVAAGVGTSHSFARADHVHAINHAITDNHIATYDGTQNSAEIVRMTANGLESRTNVEMKIQLTYLQAGDANDMADAELTRPKIKDYGETISVIGSDTTPELDLTNGNVFTDTVDTGETTYTFSNPPASGVAGSFTLIMTNGGSQTVNWPASVDWAGGTEPTLTVAGIDVLTFITIDAGTIWYGFASGLAMATP